MAERPSSGPGGRRPALIGALALVLVAALVAVPLILRGRDDPGGGATSSDNGKPTQAVAETKTCGPERDDVPKGYYAYNGPGGFDIAVPVDWVWRRKSGRIYLQDRSASARYVMVDQTDEPKADPYQDWVEQEKSVSKRLDGYKKISIEPLSCHGWKAADWEFTWDKGHVLNRNLLVSGDQAYALYLSSPEDTWAEDLETFTTMVATFKPGT